MKPRRGSWMCCGRNSGAQNSGTKYSEGVDEPWCADFVSWVMREAGRPLANPHSGAWRIPGVYTLEEYYRGEGRFEAWDSGYRPKVGDVVMYTDASPFNQHTNIVIGSDAGTIITVGGNEFGKITIHEYRPDTVSGLVGYGRYAGSISTGIGPGLSNADASQVPHSGNTGTGG
ncbi:hypothetical protein Ntsu_64980 [Nocardia sp. IFM 10818]